MDIFGISSIFCFLIGTPLNIISNAYFYTKKQSNNNSTNFIYSLISATDTIICVLSLAPMMSYILAGKPGIFGWSLSCTLWDIIMEVCVRYSLFLVAVLGVCRTRALLSPLRLYSKRYVLWVTVGFFLALLLQETLPPIALQEFATYVPQRLSCHFFGLEAVFTPLQSMIFMTVTFFGEIGIPVLVGGVAGGLSIYILLVRRDKYDNTVTEVQKKNKREATKTIAIVSGLCVLLNSPIVFISILFTSGAQVTMNTIVVATDITSSLVVLNSLFNSLVYFARIRRMRVFAKRLIVYKTSSACVRTSPEIENH